MKIKVSFSEIVDADSIDDAYKKFLYHFNCRNNNKGSKTQTLLHGHKIVTEMNGCVFEDLGEHSGYGEGSIKDWTDDQ